MCGRKLSVYLAPKMFLPEGDTCIVVRLELLKIAILIIIQLRRVVAWLPSSTNGLYLFDSDAPDVTGFAEMITRPLLVLMYSRSTVWSLVSAFFS